MGFYVVLDAIIFVGFITAVITFGILKSRHEKDSESYFLAGRGLAWWLIGFSLIAANISAEQFVGMSGQAAKDHVGLAIASYEWVAAITLVAVAFFFLPKFLRSGIYTIPEYLEYRYNHQARTLMSALMVVTLVCVNTTCIIYLGAKALEPFFSGLSLFGLPLNITALSWIVGIMAAAYVAAGGLKACAWTDLFWGSSLIVGGAIIMVLTFMALDNPDRLQDLDNATVCETIGVDQDATFTEKFGKLKQDKMHMFLPSDNPVIPWTALLLGIWIPNFYYWGLNQYIMQRTLGARSLADGQRGVVFAASLKLVIPFFVCIPGIIAFSLYHTQMQQKASDGVNKPTLAAFDEAKGSPQSAEQVFKLNDDFAGLYPDRTRDLMVFNAAVAEVPLPDNADVPAIRDGLIGMFAAEDEAFREKLDKIEKHNSELKQGQPAKQIETSELNGMLVSRAMAADKDLKESTELIGYDYDSAFPTLVANLSPFGLRGFVLAALMGAVVSTLAATLNAASTIFTMDVYKEYVNRAASQSNLVFVGRSCVPIAVLVGCFIAPQLAKPEYQGAFHFIQEFQGYISPGILTVFLFGFFIPRTPRICGIIGLLLSPIVYGLLHKFYGEMAFLNRMAITVGSLCAVLAIVTLLRPLSEPVKLPEQSKIELKSSGGAKVCGVLVVIATVILYVIFA